MWSTSTQIQMQVLDFLHLEKAALKLAIAMASSASWPFPVGFTYALNFGHNLALAPDPIYSGSCLFRVSGHTMGEAGLRVAEEPVFKNQNDFVWRVCAIGGTWQMLRNS